MNSSPSSSVLVIADGRLGSLVAAWSEGVCRVTPTGTPSGLVIWHDATLAPARRLAVERMAEVCHARELVAGSLPEHVKDPQILEGVRQSAVLFAASLAALRLKIGRIIWPIHMGGPGSDHGTTAILGSEIDAVADAYDRAMLTARLLSLDAPGDASRSGGMVIETPFIDFSDVQLMDLAADLDAPFTAAWWCARENAAATESAPEHQPPAAGCGTCIECRRWEAAAKAAGLAGIWSDPAPAVKGAR